MRTRLTNLPQDEEVEGLIESVRFRLAPIIGDDLKKLRTLIHSQKDFARYALNIANAANEIAQSLGGDLVDQHLCALRNNHLIPPDREQDDRYVESDNGDGIRLSFEDSSSDNYTVYCRDYDKIKLGKDLYRLEQRKRSRQELDRMIAAQAISVPRLALRLQALFAVTQKSGWHDGEEEGYLDGRRLSQLATQPGYYRIFKKEKSVPYCDTVVTFLIDNSGSMKRQRYQAVAILVDVYCRALELAGITTEILGFSTNGWAGGESIKAWRKNGSPENPGRLNDQLHIIYKDAESSWRRSRYSIASLMSTTHFKEGLDGEALEWACQRLNNRIETRKCLVMISDGAPMETATSNYNDAFYLERHLKQVAHTIERSSKIELRGIGIALDMEEFFSQSLTMDLTGTLGSNAFNALELLFSKSQIKIMN